MLQKLESAVQSGLTIVLLIVIGVIMLAGIKSSGSTTTKANSIIDTAIDALATPVNQFQLIFLIIALVIVFVVAKKGFKSMKGGGDGGY